MVTACGNQSVVRGREDLLAEAGFTVQPANTPARQAALRSLPPHRFVRQTQGNRVAYVYADPLVCDCLYIGDQVAYNRYRQAALQRQLASEKLLEADMNGPMTWDWGPWDPW